MEGEEGRYARSAMECGHTRGKGINSLCDITRGFRKGDHVQKIKNG